MKHVRKRRIVNWMVTSNPRIWFALNFFVTAVLIYWNCRKHFAMFAKNLAAVFILWTCPAFWWQVYILYSLQLVVNNDLHSNWQNSHIFNGEWTHTHSEKLMVDTVPCYRSKMWNIAWIGKIKWPAVEPSQYQDSFLGLNCQRCDDAFMVCAGINLPFFFTEYENWLLCFLCSISTRTGPA